MTRNKRNLFFSFLLIITTLLWEIPVFSAPDIFQVTPPAHWVEASPVTAGQSEVQLSETMPDRRWWIAFQDPDLSRYIQTAITNNPTLQAALARILQSRTQARQALGDQLPSLTSSANGGQLNIPTPLSKPPSGGGNSGFFNARKVNFLTILGNATYELDIWGKYWDITQSTKKEVKAQEADSKAVEIMLQSEVANSYFNLLRSEALYDFTIHYVANMKESYDLSVYLYQNGLETVDTLLNMERDIATQELELNRYKEEKSLYAHELSTLTGLPPQAFDKVSHTSLEKVYVPVLLQTGIPLTVITQRPDVMAQELRLQRARIDVRVARKKFLPTIKVSDYFGMTKVKAGALVNGQSFLNLLQGNLSQPLFQGGKVMANLRLEQARTREQVEIYRQTILTALKDVEDSLSTLLKTYEDQQKNDTEMDTSNRVLQLTQIMYQNGLRTRLDLFRAENDLLLQKSKAIQTKANKLIAVVGLYKALGGGY